MEGRVSIEISLAFERQHLPVEADNHFDHQRVASDNISDLLHLGAEKDNPPQI